MWWYFKCQTKIFALKKTKRERDTENKIETTRKDRHMLTRQIYQLFVLVHLLVLALTVH